MRAADRQRYARAPDGKRASAIAWAKENPEAKAEIDARRRASKLKAAPAWLTREHRREMAALYAEARRLTAATGIAHHVDHIVPLQGRTVCGLHVPWNLQILTAKANLAKRNTLLV